MAGDPDVKGVVFLAKSPELSLDRHKAWLRFSNVSANGIANLTRSIPPKQLVFHLETVHAAIFVAACAADKVTITPLTTWDVTGLRSEPMFLRDRSQR